MRWTIKVIAPKLISTAGTGRIRYQSIVSSTSIRVVHHNKKVTTNLLSIVKLLHRSSTSFLGYDSL